MVETESGASLSDQTFNCRCIAGTVQRAGPPGFFFLFRNRPFLTKIEGQNKTTGTVLQTRGEVGVDR